MDPQAARVEQLEPSFLGGLPWLAAAALPALVLYGLTVCRTAYGDFDSAEFATMVPLGGVPHAPGYPAYVLFSRAVCLAFPHNPALGANFASALAGAGGAAMMFVLVRRLTGDPLAALLAAWSLTASFSYWFMATVAEVYVMQAAIELAVLAALAFGSVRWFTIGLGLSFANHPSSVLIAGPMLLWLAMEPRMRQEALRGWAKRFAFFTSFASFYLYLPLSWHLSKHPGFWARLLPIDLARPLDLWWYLSLRAYPAELYRFELPYMARETGYVAACLLEDFSAAGVLLAVAGILVLARRWPAAGTGVFLTVAAQLGFYLGFTANDKFTMFVPAFAVFAVGIGVAMAELLALAGRRRALGFLVLLALPAFLLVRHYPQCDKAAYRASRDYALATLPHLPEGASVVGGWTAVTVLDYFATFELHRPDVELIHDGLAELAESMKRALPSDERGPWLLGERLAREARAGRPIYSTFGTPIFAGHFHREPAGLLYRLTPRAPPVFFDSRPPSWPATACLTAGGLELVGLVAEPPAARAGELLRLHYRWRLPGGEKALDRRQLTYVVNAATGKPLSLGHVRQRYQDHFVGMLRSARRQALRGQWMEEVLDFTLPPSGTETEYPPGDYVLEVELEHGPRRPAGRLTILPAR